MCVDEHYADLAKALDMLPNGFPRTASGVELRILKKIFSPEEAFLAGIGISRSCTLQDLPPPRRRKRLRSRVPASQES